MRKSTKHVCSGPFGSPEWGGAQERLDDCLKRLVDAGQSMPSTESSSDHGGWRLSLRLGQPIIILPRLSNREPEVAAGLTTKDLFRYVEGFTGYRWRRLNRNDLCKCKLERLISQINMLLSHAPAS